MGWGLVGEVRVAGLDLSRAVSGQALRQAPDHFEAGVFVGERRGW